MGVGHPWGSGGIPEEEYDLFFEPIPDQIRKRRKNGKWEVLLRKPKAAPGADFRIRNYPNKNSADQEAVRIKKRMRTIYPTEHWVYTVRQLKDSERWGLWVTYMGIYTAEELKEELAKRARRREIALKGNEARRKSAEIKRIRKGLDMGSQTLPRPRP